MGCVCLLGKLCCWCSQSSIFSQDTRQDVFRALPVKLIFLFNSNRWMTRVLQEPCPFSPRYTPLHRDYSACTCESLIVIFSIIQLLFTLCISVCVYMQMTNLAAVDASEEDKLKVILNQCTFDSVTWVLPEIQIQNYVIPISAPMVQLSTCILP